MSDFFQNGTVTTLHNLKTRSLESLEAELHQFAEHSPMALILPCLYSELAQDARAPVRVAGRELAQEKAAADEAKKAEAEKKA